MSRPGDPSHHPFDECLEHVDALFRLARRLGADRARAADLVQDTYLEAWRSFDRFTPHTNARAWLCRILYRVWYRNQQRERRRPLVFDDDLLETHAGGSTTGSDHGLVVDVHNAFRRLSAPHRAVITLADIEGFSYREVGELLDVPIGTVMSRLNRARAQMRKSLTQARTPLCAIRTWRTGTR